MTPDALRIRQRLKATEQNYRQAQQELNSLEAQCNHKYGEVVYDPIHHEAYTAPGDPPGTMGVDWRGPCYVPAQTIPRWKRECGLCGKVNYTEEIRKELTVHPNWPEDRGSR